MLRQPNMAPAKTRRGNKNNEFRIKKHESVNIYKAKEIVLDFRFNEVLRSKNFGFTEYIFSTS